MLARYPTYVRNYLLTYYLRRYEGGSIGNRERRLAWPNPAVPVTPEGPLDAMGQSMPYYLFHYTYGVEYTKEGLPVELQVGRAHPTRTPAPQHGTLFLSATAAAPWRRRGTTR